MLFFWIFYSSKNTVFFFYHSLHKNIKQNLFSMLLIIRNVAANQHIRMISEGSCDTEDWSNDALPSQEKKIHFKIFSNRKQFFVIIFHNVTVFLYFWSNKSLESCFINIKILNHLKLLNGGVHKHIFKKYMKKKSAVKWFIAINRIQNKSFCLHNICVCTVYIYYVYINTNTTMYIFKKNILCLYIKYINV